MSLRTILLVIAGAAGFASAASASDQVQYAPPESWVRAVAIPPLDSVPDSGASQLLLQDDETRFGPDLDVFYSERAVRIRTPQALDQGNLILSWKPDTETLVVHKLHIIRGDQVIDLLAGGKTLTVLRRETNLEAAALDGALTATIQPEDLRVGDTIDYAISYRRKDPLRRGFSEGFAAIAHSGVAGRVRIRVLWDAPKAMRWRATVGLDAPVPITRDGQTELLIDREKVTAPKKPAGAPERFRQVGELELSQFRDWAELSGIMAPLYEKASTLPSTSPLRAEAARIKAAAPDAKGRAFAALKLVEEQTRYVLLGMNLGGYLPADADETWRRRFGDCKGKTALLLALLHELGIEAEPAFVNSSNGDGLDQRLPMLSLFDHVIVRAQIDGKTYWLDGTRMGDRNLDDIPPPAFGWALPVRPSGARLIPIVQMGFLEPQVERIVRLDIKAGLDAPAKAHIETLIRGDAGLGVHLLTDSLSGVDLDRFLRAAWSQQYPWIKADSVGAAYNSTTGVMRTWLDGTGALNWTVNGVYRDFEIIDSAFGGDPDFRREDGPNKDAPFAVGFPAFTRRTVTVSLPEGGAGFTLWNSGEVDTTVGGVSYRRTARLQDGVIAVQSDERGLAPEFPAADADKVSATLRKMAYDNLFIRALAPSSQPVRSDEASSPSSEPLGGSALAARGATALQAQDYEGAIKVFTQAMALEPRSAEYVYDRGVAHYQRGEDDLALSDFDAALKLDPGDGLVLMARAELRLLHGREADAKADFEAALKSGGDRKAFLRRQADAYRDNGRWALAIADYDIWLKTYPSDRSANEVRGARCLARAEAGQEPEATLKECEAALALAPTLMAAKEGQAMSLLRQSRQAEATAAFNDVLKIDPAATAALYGRGVARLRAGDKAKGEADIKAAIAGDPDIASRFKSYGLAP